MKTIDLGKIIEDRGLDTKEVAELLFPKNSYPKLALNRILSGEAVLDANQISKLALFTGISIGDLYGVGDWKYKIDPKGVYTLTSGTFKAVLNTENWQTKIFDNNTLLHEEVIHAGTTALREYVTKLNDIITKYKSNEQ